MEGILYFNKGLIENGLSKAFYAVDVSIGNFLNLPLRNINIVNIQIKYPKNTLIKIKRLVIHYNVLKIPFSGVLSSIEKITLDDVDILTTVLDMTEVINKIQNSSNINVANNTLNNASKLDTKIFIRDLNLRLSIIATVRSDLYADNIIANIQNNKLLLEANLNLDTRLTNIKTNNMGNDSIYIQSAAKMNLNITDITNQIGRLRIYFKDFNVGGFNLIQNDALFFILSNSVSMDLRASSFTNFINIKHKLMRLFPNN